MTRHGSNARPTAVAQTARLKVFDFDSAGKLVLVSSQGPRRTPSITIGRDAALNEKAGFIRRRMSVKAALLHLMTAQAASLHRPKPKSG